jgi:hypothetical protein
LLLRLFFPSDVWDLCCASEASEASEAQARSDLTDAEAASASVMADAELSAHVNGLLDVPGGLLSRRHGDQLSELSRSVVAGVRSLHETSSAFAVTNPKGRLRRRTLYLFVVLFCLVQEGEFRQYVIDNSQHGESVRVWIVGFLRCALEAYFRGVSLHEVRTKEYQHETVVVNRTPQDLVAFCVARYAMLVAGQS